MTPSVSKRLSSDRGDPGSPWNLTNGWRMNAETVDIVRIRDGETAIEIGVRYRPGGWRLTLPGGDMDVTAEREADGMLAVNVDGHRLRAPVILEGDAILVMVDGRTRQLVRPDPRSQDRRGGKESISTFRH